MPVFGNDAPTNNSSLAQGLTPAQPGDAGDPSEAAQPTAAQPTVPAQDPTQAQAPSQAQPPAPAPATPMTTPDGDAQGDAQPTDLPRFHRTIGNTLKGLYEGLLQGGLPGAVTGVVSPQGMQRQADQEQQAQQTALATQKAQFNFQTAQAAAMAADAAMKAKALSNYDDVYQRSVFKSNQETADWFMNHGFNPTTVTANDGHSEMAAAKGMGTVPPLASLQVSPGQIMHFDLSQMPQQVGLDAVNQLNQQIGKVPISSDVWAQTPQTQKIAQLNGVANYWSPLATQDNVLQYKNDRARVAAIPDQQLPDKAQTLQKYDTLISNMQSVLDAQHSKDEKQKIGDYNAETPGIVKRDSEIAYAQAAAKEHFDNKPVYAVNANGDTVLTTAAQAQTGGFSAIRPVKETDIAKDQHDIKVLSDIQTKANNVYQAAGAMDNTSWTQAGVAAKYLADNPNTTLNGLFKSGVLANATPQTTAYILAVNSLRESSMGLQKVLTGTARTNETQLSALLNTLPGVEPNSGIVKQKLGAFTQNLDLLSKGLPKGTGVELQGFGGAQPGAGQQGQFQYTTKDGKLGWNGSAWVPTQPTQAPTTQAQPQPQPTNPQLPGAQGNILRKGAKWIGNHSF